MGRRRFAWWAGLTALLMMLSGGAGFFWATVSNAGSIPPDLAFQPGFKKFVHIYQLIEGRSISRTPPDQLLAGAIGGMVGSLNDPFSTYLAAGQLQALDGKLNPTYTGVGIELAASGGWVRIAEVLPHSPASQAGLRAADRIVAVNGRPADGMTVAEVTSAILGAPGSTVQMTVARQGGTFSVRMQRRSLAMPTVFGSVWPNRIGYMAIAEFGTHTGRETQTTFDRLVRQGARGILLDLRDDPGGEMDQAVKAAGVFVPAGPVVRLTFKHRANDEVLNSKGPGTSLPVVVLVNGQTASAAEILAAAIRDRHKGEVVGTRTFGKAVVQQVIQLAGGAALKLTVATYLTPAGKNLEHVGIQPAQVIPEAVGVTPSADPSQDPQLKAAERVLLGKMQSAG